MNNLPLISIIIPVYNAELYLGECIQSVLSQEYTNWELLLIDDGSSDSSREICLSYTVVDTRIKYFYKQNGGVSSARNVGLSEAKGDWITFCDSDDRFYTDTLKRYVSHINDNVDMVIGGYSEIDEDGLLLYYKSEEQSISLTSDECIYSIYQPMFFKYEGFIWNRLFRRKIIQNKGIRFDETIYYREDGLFLTDYLTSCEGICIYDLMPLYQYRINSDGAMSIINRKWTPKYLSELESRGKSLQHIRNYSTVQNLLKIVELNVYDGYKRLLLRLKYFGIKSFKTKYLIISRTVYYLSFPTFLKMQIKRFANLFSNHFKYRLSVISKRN